MKNLPLKLPKELTDKFQVVNNTLIRDVKENPKDRITLEIGDSMQPDFLPQAKIMRWDNEVNASFRYVDNEPGEPVIETKGKVIKYVKPKVEFHAYELDLSELGGDGGLEIELLLKEKPDTNKFDFTIQTKELDFFYQPSLTQQEIDEGADRPENVVGSYAVYHKTKGGMNRIDGMEYKVGKAFHIYRPKVTDANGVETWGELNIDEQNGLLSVTIDQAWLDTAVYPVLVDPTFGYTTQGGATFGNNNSTIYGYQTTLSTQASVSKLTASITYTTALGSVHKYTGAIYDTDRSGPVTNGTTDEYTTPASSSTEWRDFTFASQPSLSIGDYWLAIGVDSAGGNEGVRYDTSAVEQSRTTWIYNSWPATLDADEANNILSIYATYTVAAASTLTDNFDDNSIDTAKWDDYVLDSGTAAESSEKVILTPANSTENSEAGFNSVNDYNLTGSYAKVQLVQAADVASCYSTLKVELDSGNYMLFGVRPTNELFAVKVVAASSTDVATTTYDSGVHKYLKIREASGTIYFDYSTDGSSYSNFGSVANPFAITGVMLALTVYELNSDASPGAAHFDNFNIDISAGTVIKDIIGGGFIIAPR